MKICCLRGEIDYKSRLRNNSSKIEKQFVPIISVQKKADQFSRKWFRTDHMQILSHENLLFEIDYKSRLKNNSSKIEKELVPVISVQKKLTNFLVKGLELITCKFFT